MSKGAKTPNHRESIDCGICSDFSNTDPMYIEVDSKAARNARSV